MKMYKDLKSIFELAVRDDDYMFQDNLFYLQEKLAALLLKVAEAEHTEADLLKSFPTFFRIAED